MLTSLFQREYSKTVLRNGSKELDRLKREALRGPQGPQGVQGLQGTHGIRGEKGEQGEAGAKGEQGIQGIQGERGEQGLVCPQGIQGQMPKHQSRGDAIRFELDEGEWGKWIRLGTGHSTGGGIGKDTVNKLIQAALVEQDMQYNKLIDTVGTIKYIGESLPNTATSAIGWRIKKVDLTDEDIEITWADGTAEFTKEWDERASYDYSVPA